VVRALTKFRIDGEDPGRAYRLARVRAMPEPIEEVDRPLLARRRRQVEEAVRAVAPGARLPPREVSDEEVIDGLSLMLPIDPPERQGLLEADGPLERALELIRLLGRTTRAE